MKFFIKKFKDWKIKSKLISGFLNIILLFIILVGIFVIFNYSNSLLIRYVHEKNIKDILLFNDLQKKIIEIQQLCKEISLTKDETRFELAKIANSIATNIIKDLIRSYEYENQENAVDKLKNIETEINNYYNTGIQMTQAYLSNNHDKGNILSNEFDAIAQSLFKEMDSFITDMRTEINFSFEKIYKRYKYLYIVSPVVSVFSLMLAVLLAILIGGSIIKQINGFRDIFIEMTIGNLNQQYPLNNVKCSQITNCKTPDCSEYDKDNVLCWFDVGSYAQEFGKEIKCPGIINGKYKSCKECKVYKMVATNEITTLGAWFNKFIAVIKNIIDSIKLSSNQSLKVKQELTVSSEETFAALTQMSANIESINKQVYNLNDNITTASTSIEQISRNIENLDNQIEGQANTVSESTTSVTEMTASVNNVAKITKEKKNSTEKLVDTTMNGGEKVNLTYSVIENITKSIDDILEMINIINQIASQTDLLSMNAAIEAAHAGETGKSFAVVADEIKKFAESSSENAKNISTVLQNVVENIKSASNASSESKKAFEDINKEIKTIVYALEEVTSSAEELAVDGEHIIKVMAILSDTSSNVKNGSGEMRHGAEEIIHSMQNVSNISNEVKNGLSEINSGIKNITDAMNNMSELSRRLDSSTEVLNKEINKFKTE